MNAPDVPENQRRRVITVSPAGTIPHRVALSMRERRVAIAVVDFLLGALACYLAFVVIRHPHLHQLDIYEPFVIGAFWVVALMAADGYASEIPSDRGTSVFAVVKAAPIAGLLSVVAFFIHPYALTRPVIATALAVGGTLLIAFRLTVARLLLHESLATRIIVVSDTTPSEELVGALKAARFEYRVVGSLIGEPAGDIARRVKDLFARTGAEEVMVTSNELRLAPGLVEECLTNGVRLVSGGELIERNTGRVPIDSIDAHWYLSLPDSDVWRRPYAAARRLADLLLAVLFGVPFVLILPMLALAIVRESPGPVMLTQRRIGEGGREFGLLKLRTMTPDAEADGARYTDAGDKRVTRVGRFLRASRLDEFPQLVNIIRGEMSFIGPRPERPEFERELEARIPHFRSRLLVKPGLTGWAQVKAGYASTVDETLVKLEYDLFYIKNRSLQLDLQILVRTVGTVGGWRGR